MDIIDEIVDLARLAYESNPFEADDLITKISSRVSSEYKLGRVLSMEIARLRCDYKSKKEHDNSIIEDMQEKINELTAENEHLLSVIDEGKEIGKEVIGLIDPDLYNEIIESTKVRD